MLSYHFYRILFIKALKFGKISSNIINIKNSLVLYTKIFIYGEKMGIVFGICFIIVSVMSFLNSFVQATVMQQIVMMIISMGTLIAGILCFILNALTIKNVSKEKEINYTIVEPTKKTINMTNKNIVTDDKTKTNQDNKKNNNKELLYMFVITILIVVFIIIINLK